MTTTIISNGSKWAGESPDPVESLLDLLEREPLDPTFDRYGGGFVDFAPRHWLDAWSEEFGVTYADGAMHVHGNFYNVSHVFSIISDEREVIDRLIVAITANKRTIAYKEAADVRREQEAQRTKREQSRKVARR